MLEPRFFRLFLSSTFSDFIAEREALQKRVFPELERYCAKHGARFEAIDLRWGITEEDQHSHDTMRICLEEIRRCQQLSPRPNFAVLIGDRYGWEPVPARISQEHWFQLQFASQDTEWSLVRESYQLDENAIPPVYCLKEGRPDARLLQSIRYAARDLPYADRLLFFSSATHQEILLGALSSHDESKRPLYPEQHVHVYVRHLAGLPQDVSAKDFIDWDSEEGQPVVGARNRLRDLESLLRSQLSDRVHDLQTSWNDHGNQGKVDEKYLECFCGLFLQHQIEMIDTELASLAQIDEWQQREDAHRKFGTNRAEVFVGREEILQRIASYTMSQQKEAFDELSPDNLGSPLILLGMGGSGKSAILAKAASDLSPQAQARDAVLLQRYIGGVPGSDSILTMLGALTADIARHYRQPETPTAGNAKALVEAFLTALGYASPEKPLIVFIDALDQLDQTEGAWALEWLPQRLPEHVRIVASARADTRVGKAALMRYPQGVIDVQRMTPVEGASMLDAWLSVKRAAWFNSGIVPPRGRRLTYEQRAALLTMFSQNGSPLWLKLAYEEAATWASWDLPRRLPSTVQGLIEDLIDHRLTSKKNNRKVFTERALAYITAGRFGLSESELGRALAADESVRTEFRATQITQKRWADDKKLPPVLWSRLFFDLQPYLGLAKIDGALLMRWFHREFAEVLAARYLACDEDRKRIHGALADTLLHLERELRPDETNDDALFRATDAGGKQVSAALRRVMEQPWQLAQAGRSEELKALLTDFGFCMGKCAANHADDLAGEFRFINGANECDSLLGTWKNLLAEKRHLLFRGEPNWPAHKILLQIASEHAEDSAVTHAAETWLTKGHCNWVWLSNRKRPLRQVRSPLLAVLEGHRGRVNGAQVLPDGRLMSWSNDKTLRFWDGMGGAMPGALKRHRELVKGAQALPDGRVLSWSGSTILLWLDSLSQVSPRMLNRHTGSVIGVQVLPDGRLVSWSSDNALRLWDIASGTVLAVLEGHTDRVSGVQVLPDGRLVSWSDDNTLRLWDCMSGSVIAVLRGHIHRIRGALIMPNGRLLSWAWDNTVRLWDLETGEVSVVLEPRLMWLEGVIVLSDERLLCWHKGNRYLRIWDIQNDEIFVLLEGHADEVNGALVTPNGRILSWSRDGTLHLYAATGDLQAVLKGHTASVKGALVAPGDRVLSWSGSELRLWAAMPTSSAIADSGSSNANIYRLLTHPNGNIVTWGKNDLSSFRLWNGASGDEIAELEGHTRRIFGAKILSDGRLLSWSFDRTLRLWDGVRGTMLKVLEGHTKWVKGAQELSDGRLVSWSDDKTLRLWDGMSGAMLGVLEGHGGSVNGAQALPEGRLLSWSEDNTFRVWDRANGSVLFVLEGFLKAEDSRLNHILFPDGRLLIWSHRDTRIAIWNCSSDAGLTILEHPLEPVSGVEILSNERLLSWSGDRKQRLWDAQSGTLLSIIDDFVSRVFVVNRSSSLSRAVHKNELRIWDAVSGGLIATLKGHSGYVNDVEILKDGQILSWSEKDNTLRLWAGTNGEPLGVWAARDWVRECKFPCPWESHSVVAEMKRTGAIWFGSRPGSIHVADREAAWFARWHGGDVYAESIKDGTVAVMSGSELMFLTLMCGGEKLTVNS